MRDPAAAAAAAAASSKAGGGVVSARVCEGCYDKATNPTGLSSYLVLSCLLYARKDFVDRSMTRGLICQARLGTSKRTHTTESG